MNADGEVLLLAEPTELSWRRVDEWCAHPPTEEAARWDEAHPAEVIEPKVTLTALRDEHGSTRLTTAPTDWREVSITSQALAADRSLAASALRTLRTTGRLALPRILSAHVLLLTADGVVVATRRSPTLHFHPGRWSCSFEEGLAPGDLDLPDPLDAAARRGWNEEFGLPPDLVSSVRPTGLVVEVDGLHPSLLGEARLAVSFDELVAEARPDGEWDDLAAAVPGHEPTPAHPTNALRLAARRRVDDARGA